MYKFIEITILIICIIKFLILRLWHKIKNNGRIPRQLLNIFSPIPYSKLSFVLGAARSGTTLLIRLLKNCRYIHCTSEMHFFSHTQPKRKNSLGLRNAVSILYELNRIPNITNKWETLHILLKRKIDPSIFYGILHNHYHSIIVDKVPEYAWFRKFYYFLKKIKNKAPLIYIYRHPCTSIQSTAQVLFNGRTNHKLNIFLKKIIRRYFEGHYQAPNFDLCVDDIHSVLDFCVFNWALANYNILYYLKTNPHCKYILIPYEDMLLRPGFYYKRVCTLLNVHYYKKYSNLDDSYFHFGTKIKKMWGFDIPIGDPNQFDRHNRKIESSRAYVFRDLGEIWDKLNFQALSIANELGYTKDNFNPESLQKTLKTKHRVWGRRKRNKIEGIIFDNTH